MLSCIEPCPPKGYVQILLVPVNMTLIRNRMATDSISKDEVVLG